MTLQRVATATTAAATSMPTSMSTPATWAPQMGWTAQSQHLPPQQQLSTQQLTFAAPVGASLHQQQPIQTVQTTQVQNSVPMTALTHMVYAPQQVPPVHQTLQSQQLLLSAAQQLQGTPTTSQMQPQQLQTLPQCVLASTINCVPSGMPLTLLSPSPMSVATATQQAQQQQPVSMLPQQFFPPAAQQQQQLLATVPSAMTTPLAQVICAGTPDQRQSKPGSPDASSSNSGTSRGISATANETTWRQYYQAYGSPLQSQWHDSVWPKDWILKPYKQICTMRTKYQIPEDVFCELKAARRRYQNRMSARSRRRAKAAKRKQVASSTTESSANTSSTTTTTSTNKAASPSTAPSMSNATCSVKQEDDPSSSS
eukprot:m.64800 g.64800  ORF g.64800 m.64800 type:complete len:369 (+) comp12027_c0_seq2:1209-2315(+)